MYLRDAIFPVASLNAYAATRPDGALEVPEVLSDKNPVVEEA